MIVEVPLSATMEYQQGYGQPTDPIGMSPAPSSQQQTVVVIQQPVTTGVPYQQQNIRDWDTKICGCFEDCGSCKLPSLPLIKVEKEVPAYTPIQAAPLCDSPSLSLTRLTSGSRIPNWMGSTPLPSSYPPCSSLPLSVTLTCPSRLP